MDIQTALEKLSGFLDTLYVSGFLTKEEEEALNETENTIINYVREQREKRYENN